MNEQRLYRGLTKDGKWMYGWMFSPYNAGGKTYIVVGHLEHGKPTYTLTEVIPETVGQQVGQQDKNGVEIYEGDLLRGVIHTTGLYEVVWCEMWAGFFRKVIEASEYEPNGSELQPLSIDGAKDHEIVQEVKP